MRMQRFILPLLVAALFLTGWHMAVKLSGSTMFPTPDEVSKGLVELVEQGVLLKYIVASLFRVTWGYLLAIIIGVPFGLILGWLMMAVLGPVYDLIAKIKV